MFESMASIGTTHYKCASLTSMSTTTCELGIPLTANLTQMWNDRCVSHVVKKIGGKGLSFFCNTLLILGR